MLERPGFLDVAREVGAARRGDPRASDAADAHVHRRRRDGAPSDALAAARTSSLGALLVHPSGLLDLVMAIFEEYWRTATELLPDDDGPSTRGRRPGSAQAPAAGSHRRDDRIAAPHLAAHGPAARRRTHGARRRDDPHPARRRGRAAVVGLTMRSERMPHHPWLLSHSGGAAPRSRARRGRPCRVRRVAGRRRARGISGRSRRAPCRPGSRPPGSGGGGRAAGPGTPRGVAPASVHMIDRCRCRPGWSRARAALSGATAATEPHDSVAGRVGHGLTRGTNRGTHRTKARAPTRPMQPDGSRRDRERLRCRGDGRDEQRRDRAAGVGERAPRSEERRGVGSAARHRRRA